MSEDMLKVVEKPDGIDVAIAAFLAARLCGESAEVARKNAEAMLDFFGVPRASPGKD